MQMSPEINKLSEALSKAQGEMKPAIKDSTNPHYKSRYADLDDCWSAIRDPLSKNGLSVIQLMESKNESIFMITLLAHISGQWIRSETPILAKEPSSQSFGSACSYARRYGLCAIVGLTSNEDDDGEAAEGRKNPNFFQPKQQNDLSLATEAQISLMKNLAKNSDSKFVENILKIGGYTTFEEIKRKDASPIIQELQKHINQKDSA